VQVLSPGLEFVTSWGGYGDGDGEFDGPSDIAVGPAGTVFVTDTGNDRFQEFDHTGALRSMGGRSGTGEAEFLAPRGIAVDPDGSLYIVDYENHRLQYLSAQ